MPVLIKLVQGGSAGPQAVGAFLNGARVHLQEEQDTEELRRAKVTGRTNARRERLQVTRYFDYGRRSHKSLRLSLQELEEYLRDQDESHLEQALLQFETSERFRRSQLHIRMSLLPMVCERISRTAV